MSGPPVGPRDHQLPRALSSEELHNATQGEDAVSPDDASTDNEGELRAEFGHSYFIEGVAGPSKGNQLIMNSWLIPKLAFQRVEIYSLLAPYVDLYK